MHIHVTMSSKPLAHRPVFALPCACAGLRRAARAVTRLYDEALRPSGLRVTQFSLMQVLGRARGTLTQGTLGDLLALDSTTLSRTLRPLERRGWIRTVPGPDRRGRRPGPTQPGRGPVEPGRPPPARTGGSVASPSPRRAVGSSNAPARTGSGPKHGCANR